MLVRVWVTAQGWGNWVWVWRVDGSVAREGWGRDETRRVTNAELGDEEEEKGMLKKMGARV